MRFALLGALLFSAPALADDVCHHADGVCPSTSTSATASVLTRGAKLSHRKPLAVGGLLKKASQHDGKTVLVEGTVRRACSRMGCWMELAEQKDGPGIRVTFKDYGFFVPTDSEGAKARVEGVVKLAELSEATAAHYESEGATVPRTKEGRPQEVQLIASGVELRR